MAGAWLAETDFYEAVLIGADLDVENMKAMLIKKYYGVGTTKRGGTVGLTQKQLDSAKGDKNTEIPNGFVRPSSWSGAAAR